MRIGELASQAGKSVTALRYYEQMGLLSPPQRTEAGYRDYAPETVERVRFILRAKERGFSLKEIAAVLALYDRGQVPCERVANAARKKVARLDQRITQLQERRNALAEAVRLWQRGLLDDAPFCPMLNVSITHERSPLEMARTIEVFTAGCSLCDETLQRVRDAVAPCGCSVIERSADSAEAQGYSITSVPTIVTDGQVVFVGKPTPEQAIALLRR
jgi:DNA-binding transcriptional MerR regulator